MPKLNLTDTEIEHLRTVITDAMDELNSLHPGNYFIRELRDCLDILNNAGSNE